MRLIWNLPEYRDQHYRYSWHAPYAPFVYWGGRTKAGKRIPSRRWDRRARERFDFVAVFIRGLHGLQPRHAHIAFADVARKFDVALAGSIQTVQFPWPRRTTRLSGEIAGRIRNVVDLGRLAASQRFQKLSG